jgi:uncharacterized membrane protein (DUF485 family)
VVVVLVHQEDNLKIIFLLQFFVLYLHQIKNMKTPDELENKKLIFKATIIGIILGCVVVVGIILSDLYGF